jgi:uncharacterized membrane protein YfcA
MQPLILVGTGIGIGFFGTLLGLGGGFILVPVLLYFYHFEKSLAVGTSHAVIVLNAFSGSLAFDRQRKIDYNLAVWLAAAAIPASAFAGWYIVPRFNSPWFLVAFAAMLVVGAFYISWRGKIADHEAGAAPSPGRFRAAMVISTLSGLIAVTLGVGGGIFYVPLLAILLGRPFHRATATSTFILLLSSLVAATTLMLGGHCHFLFALWLGIGVILGAQLGARAAKRLDAPVLKKVFAVAVVVVAAKLAWDGVSQVRAARSPQPSAVQKP